MKILRTGDLAEYNADPTENTLFGALVGSGTTMMQQDEGPAPGQEEDDTDEDDDETDEDSKDDSLIPEQAELISTEKEAVSAELADMTKNSRQRQNKKRSKKER
jgi:hypothetical protein